MIGDSGTEDANAFPARDAHEGVWGAGATDPWLMLGDNASEEGGDSAYQVGLFDAYSKALGELAALLRGEGSCLPSPRDGLLSFSSSWADGRPCG